MQLEGEKNKLENLLQNNLMKKRDRILTDIQEESNQTNQEKLDSSGSELEAVDQRIAELKTQVKGSCIENHGYDLRERQINSEYSKILHALLSADYFQNDLSKKNTGIPIQIK